MTAWSIVPPRSVTAWLPSEGRRRLQVGLGLLWLLDAALQLQPHMFTRAFWGSLRALAPGNPPLVAGPITWFSDLAAGHPAAAGAAAATAQLLLAAGILWPRTVRPALAASAAWAVGVWWFGEGLGGVLTGAATPLMGAPGAAVVYAFVAVLAWPRGRPPAGGESLATSGVTGAGAARLAWALLWGSSAFWLLQPAGLAPGALRGMLAGMEPGEPGWVRALDSALAGAVGGAGGWVTALLGVGCAAVAASVLSSRWLRAGLVAAVGLAAVFWVAGDFGGVLTGAGTDPGTGPLLALLAAAYWPAGSSSPTKAPSR